jgi:hypothetical protein
MNYSAIIDELPRTTSDASAAVKQTVLAGVVRAVLMRHDAAFGTDGRVRTEIDARVVPGASDADQARAMGTPARYAEVLWRGSGSKAAEGLGGFAASASHTFLVSVYFGAGVGSEAAFVALLESEAPGTPGLLVALRALAAIETDAGDVVAVSAPQDARIVFAPARPSATGLARYQHEAAFLITLT